MCVCLRRAWEVEAEGWGFQGHPWQKESFFRLPETLSEKEKPKAVESQWKQTYLVSKGAPAVG